MCVRDAALLALHRDPKRYRLASALKQRTRRRLDHLTDAGFLRREKDSGAPTYALAK